jgi:hypothetical protein
MKKKYLLSIERIISGGQTGVDRGALDAAIELGIAHGGWCPRGRLAEDGRIPKRYKLREIDAFDYRIRTEKNVMDSDATLILYRHNLRGGTAYTRRMALKHDKPFVAVDLASSYDVAVLRQWLIDLEVKVLNVAGPRGSSSPNIDEESREFIVQLFTAVD